MAGPFGLRGRTALITGAASGIGAALAEALAARGARLALVDRDAEGLARVAAALDGRAPALSTHPLDLREAACIAALPEAVQERHGDLDLLVNNAGVALAGRFEDLALDEFEWLMDINFRAAVRMTHAFLPALRRRPEAMIVNLSSLYGIIAPAGQTAYAASKFALRGFSEALRHEYEGTGLHVMVVHPGGVATAIARNARTGAGVDPAEAARGRAAFERHLRLAPAAAADRILAGIARRMPRLIVGADARQVVLLQRLMPVRYWAVIRRALGE
ncbi:short-chain dehydrogenase/reductase SDR [Methylobacterium sp. 4-46]|uniref:SDR family NAD(P)-dependent oxidoreductase n=1 Tax=unclassified Methylobacterium TaxID=2615210 RepID=UPI000152DA6D|nr:MULTISPECIES: SDR family NAD(P)-dependent oxidoreductase [Methylobacterium]ACA18067.1 short-chain dehydrogenase/reductase SDR [Methylobacterium sp. 4-46]WFT77367.1 SDR family NAD(P)-dependent oxidoreductase [Methylobacterium nodulans]